MRIKKTPLAAAAIIACLAMGATMASDQKQPNFGAKTAEPTDAWRTLHELHLASQLADYGRETRNPMAMIVAAEMTAHASTHDVDRAKTSEGGSAEAGAEKEAGPDGSTAGLLAEARAMAGQNQALIASIDRIAATESKGRTAGPSRTIERVNSNTTDVYDIEFRGGEQAVVLVSGDGDTDLDLFIYDENGNEICTDEDLTDQLICEWQPRWTGNFKVKVKNHGDVYNQYELYTN